MPRPTVMLVASVQDDREMYAEYLRASAFVVIEVDDTAEALARAAVADVIVTDIRVRKLADGLDLIRRLRRSHRTKHIPAIVLTAYAFEHDRQRAERAGGSAFLPKPCLPEILLRAIRRVLRLRSANPRSAHARELAQDWCA
jgi:two-component system cell cycle response regulator DivK